MGQICIGASLSPALLYWFPLKFRAHVASVRIRFHVDDFQFTGYYELQFGAGYDVDVVLGVGFD